MLFTEERLRTLATSERLAKRATTAELLRESRRMPTRHLDVFLSHSRVDENFVLGAKRALESYGLSVYVDWIDDPQLDRSNVTPSTASVLRGRMKASRMFILVHSVNSSVSKWCPWELGFFDGHKGGNVFIFPISQKEENKFIGQEYLGLYPYLDALNSSIFINYPDRFRPLREAVNNVFAPI